MHPSFDVWFWGIKVCLTHKTVRLPVFWQQILGPKGVSWKHGWIWYSCADIYRAISVHDLKPDLDVCGLQTWDSTLGIDCNFKQLGRCTLWWSQLCTIGVRGWTILGIESACLGSPARANLFCAPSCWVLGLQPNLSDSPRLRPCRHTDPLSVCISIGFEAQGCSSGQQHWRGILDPPLTGGSWNLVGRTWLLCGGRVPVEPILTTAAACGTAVESSLGSAGLP